MWTGISDVHKALIASYFEIAAIDLVDEAAAKLKTEMTSKPTALDEIDRSILEKEMEKRSIENENDNDSKTRLAHLESELSDLEERQKQLTKRWNHEKYLMTRIHTIQKLVSNYILIYLFIFLFVKGSLEKFNCVREDLEDRKTDTEHLHIYLCREMK